MEKRGRERERKRKKEREITVAGAQQRANGGVRGKPTVRCELGRESGAVGESARQSETDQTRNERREREREKERERENAYGGSHGPFCEELQEDTLQEGESDTKTRKFSAPSQTVELL